MAGSQAIIVCCINVRAVVQQQGNNGLVTAVSSPVQRSFAFAAPLASVAAGLQQCLGSRGIACPRCLQQRRRGIWALQQGEQGG